MYTANNGYTRSQQSWDEPWADGLTITFCGDGYIHDVIAVDNTDIGIVIGRGYDCVATGNTIEQINQYAFTGFHVGAFDYDEAEHENAVYSFNVIYSEENKMGAGIFVGSHPWNDQTDIADSGSMVDNEIEGAVVNASVDGVRNGTFDDIQFSNPQGSAGMVGCTFSGNYTAAHFEVGLTLQSGYTTRFYHPTGCFT